jgi:hypothetical protein
MKQKEKLGVDELLSYVGDLNQICGIRAGEMTDGLSRGVRTLDVDNGSGLHFTVLPDRCLDLSNLSFNGVNCSYLSKTGIVNPKYNADGKNFFRTFYAGFLTTCGLRNVGNASEDNNEYFGIHGRISNIPAEHISYSEKWEEDKLIMTITGNVRESAFFGENMRLTRTIRCCYGENKIYLSNSIKNIGFRDEILMFLLHFNVGYPLLNEHSRFLSKSKKVYPRDNDAAKGINLYGRMQTPTKDYAEQVFYHDLETDDKGNAVVAFVNESIGLGLSLSFNKNQFPFFAQWKQMGLGEYVAAMEPCNCFVGGRHDPLNKNRLMILHSMEQRNFDVTITFYDEYSGLKQLMHKLNYI